MPHEATWDVLDPGSVPDDAPRILYTCQNCEREASLPVVGQPIAQIGDGLVFDPGPRATPKKIRCRRCRKVLSLVERVGSPEKERP